MPSPVDSVANKVGKIPMGDGKVPQSVISDDEGLTELDKYSHSTPGACAPPTMGTEARLPGVSKAELPREKIATAEPELSKQRMELALAELDQDTGGKAVQDPQGVSSQALRRWVGDQQNSDNTVPMTTAPIMLATSAEHFLPHLLRLRRGLHPKEIPRLSGNPSEYWGFI